MEDDEDREDKLQRIILSAGLTDACGLRRTQIDALIAAGRFPKPVKLSARRKGWLESEIIRWQRARIAERDGTAAPANDQAP
jgi:prophage regulatory protein